MQSVYIYTIYTHSGILFSYEKEGNLAKCETSQSDKDKYCMISLICET